MTIQTHVLLAVDEYARTIQCLHPSQLSMVTANIAAGHAVSLCSCGSVIVARERHMTIARYVAHIKAVSAAHE